MLNVFYEMHVVMTVLYILDIHLCDVSGYHIGIITRLHVDIMLADCGLTVTV